jgi:hypothetical protein
MGKFIKADLSRACLIKFEILNVKWLNRSFDYTTEKNFGLEVPNPCFKIKR